jgi:hypothetical protein
MFCIFEVGAIEIVGKLLEIFKWVGPMCHWPTTAHGSVSAHRAYTHAAAPRWLSYRTPLRAQCCRPQHALPMCAAIAHPYPLPWALKQSESPFLLPITIS